MILHHTDLRCLAFVTRSGLMSFFSPDHERLNQTPRHSGVVGTPGNSNGVDSQRQRQDQRPLIEKRGKVFGDHNIHTDAVELLLEGLDHPWPTFKSIPSENVRQIFERFRTRYRWPPEEEVNIYTAFKNVQKERYKDRLGDYKKFAKRAAKKDNQQVTQIRQSFGILRSYPPPRIQPDVWQKLCDWKKKSFIAEKNRNTPDISGLTARHTGGSIEIAEHRLRIKKLSGKEPEWLDLFCQTRLMSNSKAKYFAGDLDEFQFCNGTSKEAYVSFNDGLVEKYGDDPTQQLRSDPDLWRDTQMRRVGGKTKGRIYGIGSSDLHFAITGTYSTGSSSFSADTESQNEVKKLREEMEKMKNDMNEREVQRELQMQQREAQWKLQMEEQQAQMEL